MANRRSAIYALCYLVMVIFQISRPAYPNPLLSLQFQSSIWVAYRFNLISPMNLTDPSDRRCFSSRDISILLNRVVCSCIRSVPGGCFPRRYLRFLTDAFSPLHLYGDIIWVFDPGIIGTVSPKGIGLNRTQIGVTQRGNTVTNRQRCVRHYNVHGLYLSVWKRTTKFGEVDTFSFPAVALVNDPIPPNGVSEKKTNIPDATSPYAENISKRTKDFTSYANRRVIEPQILQERHQLWGKRQWIFQYHNKSSEVGDFFFSVLMLVDDAISMRIRRLNQQQAGNYSTNTIIHISFFRRVPKSLVLRCNGWIADLAFRKRKRWYIDKKQMFPKLESHSRLTDKTRATKNIFRIAAPKLFCFFVTKIFVCNYIPMCNITIFGSY